MSYLESLVLDCLKQLNGERTIFAIYHLLKGKKSSQTIQDAHLFGLTKLFGIYQKLTRGSIENISKKALERKWIVSCGEHRFLLTTAGEDMLKTAHQQWPVPLYINGWKYDRVDDRFWERLSLFVQVLSNLIHEKTRYIPIQKNQQTHDWMKSFLKKNKLPKNRLASTLFSELVECLEQEKKIDPSVLIFRLTGSDIIGLTSLQLSEKLNMESGHYHLQFKNVLHYIMEQVTTNSNRYPLLASMLTDTKPGKRLTKSSQITYDMLKKGYSINEIATRRGLKTNTIEDHIVEMTLNIADFSIDPYVDKKMQNKIIAAAQKTSSKQLKLIRNSVDCGNYFEIRLVLAKYGDGL